jgi:hypothetical protein
MTFKDKILVYIHNKSSQLEKEFEDTVNHQRYRKLDEYDYLESIMLKVRKDTFNEFVSDIMRIIGISDKGSAKGKKHT